MKNNYSFLNFEKIKGETTGRYDQIAGNYSQDWRGKNDPIQLNYLKKFQRLIGNPPKKILEVGCGNGKDCIYFAKKGYQIYGIDLSRGMLKIAMLHSKRLKINYSTGDMRFLKFPSDFFDGLRTVGAIVHLPSGDQQRAIKEFRRVLKPTGILYIGVQNFFSTKHLFRMLQSNFSYFKDSKEDTLLIKIKTIQTRFKAGYAHLDQRHWFYPKKSFLIKTLREADFDIIECNNLFSRRLNIFARKR